MADYESKPEYCESCDWETTELTECDAFARTPGHGPFTPDDEKQWAWLCNVCRSTKAGSAFLYPRNYDNQDVLSTVAWGINATLAAIKGNK